MESLEEIRQYLRIPDWNGLNELSRCIKIIDSSKSLDYLENKVELSTDVFPRQFEDGEIVHFHLEDKTPHRYPDPEILYHSEGIDSTFEGHLFGFESQIFYRKQEIPVILTLGNTYLKEVIKENLRHFKRIEQSEGNYVFYVVKKIPRKTSEDSSEK